LNTKPFSVKNKWAKAWFYQGKEAADKPRAAARTDFEKILQKTLAK